MVHAIDATRALYICSAISIIILLTRLTATRIRYKRFDRSSILVLLSLIILVARLITDYYYLEYGTATSYLFTATPPHLSAARLAQIKTGSILVLVSRALITTFYWLQICLLLIFYSAMFRDLHWVWTIRATWVAIAASYVACIVITFAECHPFHLYYQITPSPGHCILAYGQLLSQGICNIILDLLLLALASPLVFIRPSSQRSRNYILRVWLLYTIGCFCTVTTVLRIVYLYADDSKSYQSERSFWASVQEVTSCFVANAPWVYGCVVVVRRRGMERRMRSKSRPEGWGWWGGSYASGSGSRGVGGSVGGGGVEQQQQGAGTDMSVAGGGAGVQAVARAAAGVGARGAGGGVPVRSDFVDDDDDDDDADDDDVRNFGGGHGDSDEEKGVVARHVSGSSQ